MGFRKFAVSRFLLPTLGRTATAIATIHFSATIGIRRKHDKDEIFGIKVVKTSKKLRQEPLLKDQLNLSSLRKL